ncbi:MAG: hypothetical protein H0V70_05830 [Ktedonobacteraceae bacterium]|nr:hypothetical protein [Ktedonobacteraceae bacterium]
MLKDDWREVTLEHIISVERVAAQFHIFLEDQIADTFVKVKILENAEGKFRGITNMAVKDMETGEPLWVGGKGETIAEALEQTVRLLLKTANGRKLHFEDVVWKNLRRF